MNNEVKTTEKQSTVQKLAEFSFVIYLTAIYFFNSNSDNVAIARFLFLPFAGLSILYLLQKKRFHLGKNIMAAYMSCAWIFASYFWAINEYVAWTNIKTMWQIFLLFFLTYNLFCEKENAQDFFIKSLYIAGIAFVGYSIYTYGLSEALNMMSGQTSTRLGKEIGQANDFGMLHASTCMIAFYYLVYKKKHKLLHVLILALTFLFAMSSGSRKALIMICAGMLYMIYLRYGWRQVYKVIAVTVVSALVFVAVIHLPLFDTIRYRMEGFVDMLTNGVGDGSSNTRMSMIVEGWELFKDKLLMGYGANNYRIASNFGTYAHNNFIEVLVDFGLVGFILYYLVYWNAFENLIKTKSDGGKALLCIFVVRLVMEVAMVTYYSKLTWIFLAMFLTGKKNRENNSEGEDENEEGVVENKKSLV